MTSLDSRKTGTNEVSAELVTGNTRLVFKQGSVHLFWKDVPVTSRNGIYIYFEHEAEKTEPKPKKKVKPLKEFSFNNCSWEVEKHSDNLLLLKGYWDNLPFVMSWLISSTADDSFNTEISLQVREEKTVISGELSLDVRTEYWLWDYSTDTAGFSDPHYQMSHDYCGRPEDNYFALTSSNPNHPTLKLESHRDNFYIQMKAGTYLKGSADRFLKCSRLIRDAGKLLQREYRFFKGELSLVRHSLPSLKNPEKIRDKSNRILIINSAGRHQLEHLLTALRKVDETCNIDIFAPDYNIDNLIASHDHLSLITKSFSSVRGPIGKVMSKIKQIRDLRSKKYDSILLHITHYNQPAQGRRKFFAYLAGGKQRLWIDGSGTMHTLEDHIYLLAQLGGSILKILFLLVLAPVSFVLFFVLLIYFLGKTKRFS